ncbi:hypothetical protein [Novosphingobium sp. Rr 2-17]|nr:hypothetical protein [Novosphingobium sp. Rr 2-17]
MVGEPQQHSVASRIVAEQQRRRRFVGGADGTGASVAAEHVPSR